MLLLGRAGPPQMTDAVVRMVEDVARRVAQAVVTARQYTRQTTISRALQRRQLPASLASIPGVETAIVYEPHGEGQTVGGDFYDLFPMGDGRWCFLLGDVQGKDPEAMSVTGLARHLVRLLAREGHGVESVLGRLNAAMAEESAEAARASGGESAQPRFLSLLYGELEPDPRRGGARCTVASAGHPLPLRLSTDGTVAPACEPQMLLGIDEGAEFTRQLLRPRARRDAAVRDRRGDRTPQRQPAAGRRRRPGRRAARVRGPGRQGAWRSGCGGRPTTSGRSRSRTTSRCWCCRRRRPTRARATFRSRRPAPDVGVRAVRPRLMQVGTGFPFHRQVQGPYWSSPRSPTERFHGQEQQLLDHRPRHRVAGARAPSGAKARSRTSGAT